jgi:putative oxidoreductase
MKDQIQNISALVGRVLLASLFLYAGYGKLMDSAGTKAYIAASGLPVPSAAYVVALVIEILLPLLLIAGWKARPVAAVMAAFTVVTALVFHADASQAIQFYKNMAITGGLLQVVAFGSGAYTIKRLFKSQI